MSLASPARVRSSVLGRRLAPATVLTAAGLLGWSIASTQSPEHLLLNFVALAGFVVAAPCLLWPAKRRGVILRALAVVMVTLVIVASAECLMLLRVIDYRLAFGTPVAVPSHDPRNLWDEDLLFRRRPGSVYTGESRGGDLSFAWSVPDPTTHTFDLRYDQDGFRNPGPLPQADIVVLGDSFVEGVFVAQSDLLTTRLAAQTGHTVVNLGLSSYGPQQELAALRRYGFPRAPKVVVWVFFEGNDLRDLDTYDQLRQEGPTAGDRLVDRSFTKNLVLGLHRLLGSPRPSAVSRSAIFGPPASGPRVYFMYEAGPLTPSERDALPRFEGLLRDATARCAEHGARLVLAFAPTAFRALRPGLQLEPGTLVADWEPNALPQLIGDLAKRVDPTIAFVDLTPPLERAARAGKLTYFTDDSHWSPEGHRLAAETLGDALRPLLEAP